MSDASPAFASVTPTAATFVGNFNLVAKTVGTIPGSAPVTSPLYGEYVSGTKGLSYGGFPAAAYGPLFINNFTRSAPYSATVPFGDVYSGTEPFSWISEVSWFNCVSGLAGVSKCATQPTGKDTSVVSGLIGASDSARYQQGPDFAMARLFATYHDDLFFAVAEPSWNDSTYATANVGTYAVVNTVTNAAYPVGSALNFDAYMSGEQSSGLPGYNAVGTGYQKFAAWPTWQNGSLQFLPFTMVGAFSSDYAEKEAYPSGVLYASGTIAAWNNAISPGILSDFANIMNNIEKTVGKAESIAIVAPSYELGGTGNLFSGAMSSLPSLIWTDGSGNSAFVSGTSCVVFSGENEYSGYPYNDPLLEAVNKSGSQGISRLTFSQAWVQSLWNQAQTASPNLALWGANDYGVWAPNVPAAVNGQITQWGSNQFVLLNPITKKYAIFTIKPAAGDQVATDFCAAGVASPVALLQTALTPPSIPGTLASDGNGKGGLYAAFYDTSGGVASYLHLTIGTGQSLATLLS